MGLVFKTCSTRMSMICKVSLQAVTEYWRSGDKQTEEYGMGNFGIEATTGLMTCCCCECLKVFEEDTAAALAARVATGGSRSIVVGDEGHFIV